MTPLKKGCVIIDTPNKKIELTQSLISEICDLMKIDKYKNIFINQLKNNEFKYDISKWKF
jgi:hypothetical protein